LPWDDRFNQQAKLSDLSKPLMLEYLREVSSALADDADEMSVKALAHQIFHRDHEGWRPAAGGQMCRMPR